MEMKLTGKWVNHQKRQRTKYSMENQIIPEPKIRKYEGKLMYNHMKT